LAPGGGFFAAVYAAVRRIPKGRVTTYGALAALLGVPRGARAVGWALRALSGEVKPAVPWHRVVGSGGRISTRDGAGMVEQRRRLLQEGVRFRGACVAMERHALQGQPPPTRGRRNRSRARRRR
jgi:methylated-DNA-protein-cysteine methyltransferase-like protein